jgi:hypothetical protein
MKAGALIKKIFKTTEFHLFYRATVFYGSRSRWLPGLRHGAATVRFLGLRLKSCRGYGLFVSCECYVLSRTGL